MTLQLDPARLGQPLQRDRSFSIPDQRQPSLPPAGPRPVSSSSWYFTARTKEKGIEVNQLVNEPLKRDIELIKTAKYSSPRVVTFGQGNTLTTGGVDEEE